MKNKGFTLVELLVVIVILGIITGMSWPAISRIQESNKISKYENYGDAMTAAAKLYVDAYEEDIFLYEDDLTPEERDVGQCQYIMLYELIEHSLIKDFSGNGISCNSENSFVKVTRRKGRYEYTYYLGCGNAHADQSRLETSEVVFTLPIEGTINYPDPTTCSVSARPDSPLIHNVTAVSTNPNYNTSTLQVKVESTDPDSNTTDLKVCVSQTEECPDTAYKDYGTDEKFSTNLNLGNVPFDGTNYKIYVKVKDPSGNITGVQTNYRIYQECNTTVKTGEVLLTNCSKACNGGTQMVSDKYRDLYLEKECPSINRIQSCNTFNCCRETILEYTDWVDTSSSCSRECGTGVKTQKRYAIKKSVYDSSTCNIITETRQTECNTFACTPILASVTRGYVVDCSPNNSVYTLSDRECTVKSVSSPGASAYPSLQYNYGSSETNANMMFVTAYDTMHGATGTTNNGYSISFCSNQTVSSCAYEGIVHGKITYYNRDMSTGRQTGRLIINVNRGF